MSLTAEEQQSLQGDLSGYGADKSAGVVGRKPGMPVAGVDGNWQCRQCNNVNFASREQCNRCGGMGGNCGAGGYGGQQWGGGGSSSGGMAGNWNCGECGNLNYAHRLRCNRCDAAPPTAGAGMGAMAGGAAAMAGMGMMGAQRSVDDIGRQYLMCFANENDPVQAAMSYLSMNAVNMMQRPAEYAAAGYGAGYGAAYPQQRGGMYGGAAAGGMGAGNKRARGGPPKAGIDGNWECKGCQNINFASRVECNRCKTLKEE